MQKNQFLQFFFADSKSRALELSNDISLSFRGGWGQIDPPPAYPGFEVPQRG